MKLLRTCIQLLAKAVVNDGNFLLNVGPTGEGLIEPRQVARLRDIGRWLERFGGAVYETRGGPFRSAEWGGSTHRGTRVYVHILDWPEDVLELPPLESRIVSSRSLTGSEAKVAETARGISISVPPADRQAMDTIVELELDRPPRIVASRA